MDWLRVGVDALTAPSAHLAQRVERATARLLAGCVAAIGGIVTLLQLGYGAATVQSLSLWSAFAFLSISYLLSRTRHYLAGAVVASLMFPVVACWEIVERGYLEASTLGYLMLAPFFAGMFLGVRASLLFGVLNLVVLSCVPLALRAPVSVKHMAGPMAVSLLATVLAASYAIRRDWLEQRRREGAKFQEAQLLQMQKMEAVGRLAGGIAHDFNNLLTVISGGVELLGRKGNQKELRLIESATNSARALTSQLLTLSRQSVVEHASCDLGRNLAQIDQFLSRIIGEHITLKIRVEPHLHHVRLSDTQLQQILLNLATNARDAMPRGGVLELAARNEGENVILTVTDTGVGMDEITLERAFEPFFTTKPVGKGTGLGLSMVFGLITQAGGEIFVDSKPGEGTAFRLVLRRGEEIAIGSEINDQGLELWGNAEGTILLVEDDPRVRSVCRTVLRREGYKVIDAGDPIEAIELFRARRHEVDLVISDVVMPQMTGIELGEVLRRERPDLTILFVSGYAPEDMLGRGLDSRTLLKKPFRPVELLRRVSALMHGLDSQAPPAVAVGGAVDSGVSVHPRSLLRVRDSETHEFSAPTDVQRDEGDVASSRKHTAG